MFTPLEREYLQKEMQRIAQEAVSRAVRDLSAFLDGYALGGGPVMGLEDDDADLSDLLNPPRHEPPPPL